MDRPIDNNRLETLAQKLSRVSSPALDTYLQQHAIGNITLTEAYGAALLEAVVENHKMRELLKAHAEEKARLVPDSVRVHQSILAGRPPREFWLKPRINESPAYGGHFTTSKNVMDGWVKEGATVIHVVEKL